MYQNKNRMPAIPDYQVKYQPDEINSLKEIKNSLRRSRQARKSLQLEHKKHPKTGRTPKHELVSIKSSSRLALTL